MKTVLPVRVKSSPLLFMEPSSLKTGLLLELLDGMLVDQQGPVVKKKTSTHLMQQGYIIEKYKDIALAIVMYIDNLIPCMNFLKHACHTIYSLAIVQGYFRWIK